MNDIQKFNRVLGFVPASFILCLLVMGLIGFLNFHEIPVYGKHPDPYSLGIDWLYFPLNITIFASVFAIPAVLFLTIHLLLNKISFLKVDIISLAACGLSILIFLLLKYRFTSLFDWILD